MSAGSSRSSSMRPAPLARAAGATSAREALAAAAAPVPFDHYEDEFRLDLSDIPRMRFSLHIEGLKPTLLSRLLDLIAPLSR